MIDCRRRSERARRGLELLPRLAHLAGLPVRQGRHQAVAVTRRLRPRRQGSAHLGIGTGEQRVACDAVRELRSLRFGTHAGRERLKLPQIVGLLVSHPEQPADLLTAHQNLKEPAVLLISRERLQQAHGLVTQLERAEQRVRAQTAVNPGEQAVERATMETRQREVVRRK